MGVILSEAADASESMQHTALLETINRSPFGKPHRQIAVGAERILINVHVKRAVHRLQVIELLVDLDGGVHVLGIKAEVPAGFPQGGASDMRRVNEVVAGFEMAL